MRLAVFTKNYTNPAYGAARLGAERAATVFGDEVFSPVHATQINPAIRRVVAAGIPMIGFVNPINAAPMVGYVSSDDHQLALAISGYLFKHLQGKGRVLVVTGPEAAYTSLERLRGFHDAARAVPGITLVGHVAGDYVREVAREGTAAWLQVNAAPDAVLVANDIMAIGVLDALDAAGRTVAVVGVNAIPQAIEAIAAGRMLATADFNAMQMAYLAAECAARHLRGETVPPRIELPVQIVDGSNYTQWNLPYEQRPVITLEQLRSET